MCTDLSDFSRQLQHDVRVLLNDKSVDKNVDKRILEVFHGLKPGEELDGE